MTDNAKNKAKFRSSKTWQSFRKAKQANNKVDYITQKKLLPGWNLHHLNLNEEKYNDLSNPDDFICLNSSTHDIIHFLYRYYVKDPEILTRLKEVLDKMVEINLTP